MNNYSGAVIRYTDHSKMEVASKTAVEGTSYLLCEIGPRIMFGWHVYRAIVPKTRAFSYQVAVPL